MPQRVHLWYPQSSLSMKYLFIAALLGFIFFSGHQSLADSSPRDDEQESYPMDAQGKARGAGFPDNPIDPSPAAEKPVLKSSGAESLPSLNGILDKKVKQTMEAIRDVLRGSRIPPNSDIPIVFNDSVDQHIRSFTGPKRDSFAQWLVRAKKYEPTIRQILRKKHLPEDLVYVAMIESGFNMKACSRANAMGPWQFMDETGRQYGLRVDYWMDERYDLEKSTVAAARYLKKLFDQFGCWYLATASYNAGENRVRKAMEDGRTKDFWELREQNVLPQETQEYVPQLIAATVIAKDPERYGFTGTGVAPFRPAKLSVPGGVPLSEIAKTVSVELADLRVLNPELLQGIIPPDVKRYRISLPEARKASLSTPKMKNGLRWGKRVVNVLQHRMKAKDTVNVIERRYGVTQDDLLLVNADGLDTQQGQIIYIPRFAGGNKTIRSSKTAKARLANARTATTIKKPSLSSPTKRKANLAVRTVKK